MAADPGRVKDIFVRLITAEPTARETILVRECGGDQDMRRRLDGSRMVAVALSGSWVGRVTTAVRVWDVTTGRR